MLVWCERKILLLAGEAAIRIECLNGHQHTLYHVEERKWFHVATVCVKNHGDKFQCVRYLGESSAGKTSFAVNKQCVFKTFAS